MFRLRIETWSPVGVGNGFGSAGIADREVVADAYGLPFFPGRRLKGLLRDGYRALDVCENLQPCAEDILFGRPGATDAGLLRIGDATLDGAAELRTWLRENQFLTSQTVLDAHTVLRQQTKIDQTTGTAAKNTLRIVRCLRAGLRFHAPVAELPESGVRAMALAAAAVQTAGVSRNRGTGQVKCALEEFRNGAWFDQTAAVFGTESGDLARPTEHTRHIHQPITLPQGGNDRRERFFRVDLESNALAPTLTSDSFTVETSESIPGSSLRGAFAQLYMASRGAASDDSFERLFCGGVHFGPASVKCGDAEDRALPIPKYFREEKGKDGVLWNLADGADKDSQEDSLEDTAEPQFRRKEGWCNWNDVLNGGTVRTYALRTELRYHHARNADRRKGRATGTGGGQGALFTNRSLQSGQTFVGVVTGSAEELAALQQIAPDGQQIFVGRSRSAEYGGAAKLRWMGDAKACEGTVYLPPADDDGFEYGYGDEEDPDDEAAEVKTWERFVVVLATPMTSANSNGHGSGEFPIAELARRLGLQPGDLTVEQEFVRMATYGAYLSHLRMPRSPAYCFDAGSAWTFHSNVRLTEGQLRSATAEPLGGRLEDGFGSFVIRAMAARSGDAVRTKSANADEAVSRKSSGPSPVAAVQKLKQKLFREHVFAKSRKLALENAAELAKNLKVSSSLLRRLVQVLDSTNMKAFEERLPYPEAKKNKEGQPEARKTELKSAALRQLERTERKAGPFRQTLREFLSSPRDKLFVYLVREAWMEGWAGVYPEPAGNPLVLRETVLEPDIAEKVVRAYRRTYLSALARAKSQSGESDGRK
jgi:CRISPR/Cas system CSM-associated protein Csm3 (group 7 of RAMP superfamily)